MSEDIKDRQESELQVLKSIYGDLVQDNRSNNAWNLWRPLDILITLGPLYNSSMPEIHCSVTLNIKCCESYPEEVPTIFVTKVRGISNENASKLLQELKSLALAQVGEVMIYNLAQHVQQFLYEHNKPSLSFYEQMVKHNSEKEKLQQEKKQVKENEERQKINEEIQKRQDILRNGTKQVHWSSMMEEEKENNGNEDKKIGSQLLCYAEHKLSTNKIYSSVDLPCTCNIKCSEVIRVTQKNNRKVFIGNCLGHSSKGSTTFLAIDEDSGDHFVVKKWVLPIATDLQLRNQQYTQLQQDLKAMCRIKDSCLVPYLASEMPKEVKRSGKSIYLFREYVLGCSLKYLKEKLSEYSDNIEALKLLRHVGLGVFSALKDLHEVNVLHRDVRYENVFLDKTGKVRLVGAALDALLTEMLENKSSVERPLVSHTKAQDIYDTAQLLLSIVSQEPGHEVPPELPGPAKDFFSRCLTEDMDSLWTAEQLMNHGFLVDNPSTVPKKKDDVDEEEDGINKKFDNSTTNSKLRLHVEFTVLKYIGKGAFGNVLKVKNKLDGVVYAIKSIQLNPKNRELKKKITREVKLLSRLNNDNVVRYFNAWIETYTTRTNSEASSICSGSLSIQKTDNAPNSDKDKQAEEVKMEWSINEKPVSKKENEEEDDGDEGDEGDEVDAYYSEEEDGNYGSWSRISPGTEDVFGEMGKVKKVEDSNDVSSGIQFQHDSQDKSKTLPSEITSIPDAPKPPSLGIKQYLYIQMEFCENNTLRQAIDNGLYQEKVRAWRLFREIVEGLAHIHKKGTIHRDLKPVNIFLDSKDHVKIGDFGLATKALTIASVEGTRQQDDLGASHTGQVGTAMYVAPELESARKVVYNQKVDLYSLGIILFEMFHPNFTTGMERTRVLTQLRTKDIVMPPEFVNDANAKQIRVIRWLLNHNASLRPTCDDLLASEHVPRPVPEGALSGLLSHTLNGNHNSKGYKMLVSACLNQRMSTAEDITFYNEMPTKCRKTVAAVKDILIKIFRSHGAEEFSPPLLLPRSKHWDKYHKAVKVMTASGAVCHLPHDLRLPFASHIARAKQKYMRRYVVDRVFRERARRFHPHEILHCAFDIVTPKTDTFWSDAELLVIASRIAKECSLKVALHLNHTDLLQALLLSYGVPLDKHANLYQILVDYRFGKITNLQLQTHFASLCIIDSDKIKWKDLKSNDVPMNDIRDYLKTLINPKYNKITSQAVHELECVYRNANALGCKVPITIAPFLASSPNQYSGVFWQMKLLRDEQKSAKHRIRDIIAAGGRYDVIVNEFFKASDPGRDAELNCCSVGLTMTLDGLASNLNKMEVDIPPPLKIVEWAFICVCVWGTAGSGREDILATKRANLAKELWAAGYSCFTWPGRSTEVGELVGYCSEAQDSVGAELVVVLMQDDTSVRVSSWGKDKGMECKKIAYTDVVDYIKQKLNPETVRTPEASGRSISWNEGEKSNGPAISVTFITSRMTKPSKKHCENQIHNQVTSTLEKLGMQPILGKVRVWVAALECEAACVRALAAQLDAPLDEHNLHHAFHTVCSAYPKHENILDEAQSVLTNWVKQSNQSRLNDETQLYALYSLTGQLCRMIT